MKIALIDDEPHEIKLLEQILTEEFNDADIEITSIQSFSSGEDFLRIWNYGMYDVVLLDMFMNVLSGIDVARKIRETDKDVKLIFCTTSNEFASESYSVNASYYLRKPVSRDDIRTMLKKINPDNYELVRFITLPDGQRLIIRNIIYTEYFNHMAYIHTKAGNDIKVRILQTELEDALSEFSYFFPCSKGILVNFYEVSGFDKDVFVMSNGSKVPVSRRKVKETENAYAEFMFRKLREEMGK